MSSINLLEFIAVVVNVWWIILRKGPGQTILDFTDNSSALGWLYKSSFNTVTYVSHDVIARQMATIFLENNAKLYSQHIKGGKCDR